MFSAKLERWPWCGLGLEPIWMGAGGDLGEAAALVRERNGVGASFFAAVSTLSAIAAAEV